MEAQSILAPAYFTNAYTAAKTVTLTANVRAALVTRYTRRSATAASKALWELLDIRDYTAQERTDAYLRVLDNIAAMDRTGKTELEQYEILYKMVQDAFGRDFRDRSGLDDPNFLTETQVAARQALLSGIQALGMPQKKESELYRQYLYGTLNEQGVYDIIASKYPEPSQMTTRDFFQMAFEIWDAGVDGGLYEASQCLFRYLSYQNSLYDPDYSANEMSKPVDIKSMCEYLNSYIYCGNGWRLPSTIGSRLGELFGIQRLSNGYFICGLMSSEDILAWKKG